MYRLFVAGALVAATRDAATDDEIWGKLSALSDAGHGALDDELVGLMDAWGERDDAASWV